MIVLHPAAESATGLIESAIQLVAASDAVRWCAYVTGEDEGGWRVLHGSGSGAPEPGALLAPDDVRSLDLRPIPWSRPHSGDAAGALPAGPEAAIAVAHHDTVSAAPDALHRLLSHLHAFVSHLPTAGLLHHQPQGNESATQNEASGQDTPGAAFGLDGVSGVLREDVIRARLEEETARARRYNGTLSVVVLDVDVTDTIEREREAHASGNVVGPAVLRAAGDALQRHLRQMDHAGRLGADRFLVLLPETGAEEALAATRRLGQLIGQAIEARSGASETSAPAFELRAGISTFPIASQAAADLLDQAERALRDTRRSHAGDWLQHALGHVSPDAEAGFRCVCRHCGQIFEVNDRAHQRSRRFCSHACYVADRREQERVRDTAIRAARRAGASLRDIAQRHGISAERVRQICQREPDA